jgi:23S rRNA (guanosine2251-2'-O)-methyltransferase
VNNEKDTVIGRIPVLECLRAQKRKALQLFLLQSGRGLEEIEGAACHIPTQHTSRQELDRLCNGENHQGVVLLAKPLHLRTLNEWLARDIAKDAFIVILDCVEDPHNFGAIVRSAAACGAAAILFARDRSAPISPTTMKSAAGAMEHIDLIQVPNIARAAKELKKHEFWIAALMPEAPQVLWEANLRGRIALVVGNEGKGIRPLVEKQCDLTVRIPLTGAITSLNASVSTAIALAECVRQRHVPKPSASPS